MDSSDQTPSPVGGMNIFWTIFGLALACSLHPLGSACGFHPEFARYVRVLPLCNPLDILIFIYEYYLLAEADKWTFWKPLVDLAADRCSHAIGLAPPQDVEQAPQLQDPAGDGHEDGAATVSALAFFSLDFRSRLIQNALVVFLYAKLWGYHGIPVSFGIATTYFTSWTIMELVLILAHGFRVLPYKRLRSALTMGSGQTAAQLASPQHYGGCRRTLALSWKTQEKLACVTIFVLYGQACLCVVWLLKPVCLRAANVSLVITNMTSSVCCMSFIGLPTAFQEPCSSISMDKGFLLFGYTGPLVSLGMVLWLVAMHYHFSFFHLARVSILVVVVGFVLACTVYWDPAGTWKEDWTEQLG
jgi:hypothetical protein